MYQEDFLVISTGAQSKMYTLRHMLKEPVYSTSPFCGNTVPNGFRWVSQFITNLSITKETAIQKAKDYAMKNGLKISSKVNFDLEQIQRQDKRVLEVARRKEQRRLAMIKDLPKTLTAWQYQARREAKQCKILTGGKHDGKNIFEAPRSYLKWIAENDSTETPNNKTGWLFRYIAGYFKANPFEVEKESNYQGAVKDKVELELTCINKTYFQTMYGYTDVYTLTDSAGNVFVIKYTGSVWEMDEGEKATFKGTIKEHSTYRDVKQTVLTRAKRIN